jgi:hypothetical protein
LGANVSSKVSVQQSSVVPEGFINSAVITSLSAYTIAAGEEINFGQRIEGFNAADLGWGTASAQTVTLSFWVRSSLTGLFSGAVKNDGANRSYVFTYTINSSNAWEYKTVTIPGDTSGTWLKNNGIGVIAQFCISSSSTYLGSAGSWQGTNLSGVTGTTQLVGTNGATFYITGVQFEDGAVATPFERRQYGTELMLAQRYYFKSSAYEPCGAFWSTGDAFFTQKLPTTMRADPTITFPAGPYTAAIDQIGVGSRTPTSLTSFLPTANQLSFYASGMTGATLGNPARWQNSGIQASAEL